LATLTDGSIDNVLTARTALFTPANRPDRIAKAPGTSADIVIADLEDAVGEAEKGAARELLKQFLSDSEQDALHRVVVRINRPTTSHGEEDLAMLSELTQHPAAIMVPKAEAQGVLDRLPAALSSVKVVALVETPTGIRDIHAIAALDRVDRLAIGAIDLSAALGCQVDSTPIHTARAGLVIASAAAGLPAPLDSPGTNFRDPDEMRATADRSARDGFGGTLCIHPRQLEYVLEAFTPTDEAIDWAKRVVAVGDGAGVVDGEMVDRPVLLRAERILLAAGQESQV